MLSLVHGGLAAQQLVNQALRTQDAGRRTQDAGRRTQEYSAGEGARAGVPFDGRDDSGSQAGGGLSTSAHQQVVRVVAWSNPCSKPVWGGRIVIAAARASSFSQDAVHQSAAGALDASNCAFAVTLGTVRYCTLLAASRTRHGCLPSPFSNVPSSHRSGRLPGLRHRLRVPNPHAPTPIHRPARLCHFLSRLLPRTALQDSHPGSG
ncbi:hypothetical protein EJ07DRAFT_154235 [Lizonia empirigonia]|nr:hypothetical protein EJ07DRAFT_154235 [Lizonia empirigonia]